MSGTRGGRRLLAFACSAVAVSVLAACGGGGSSSSGGSNSQPVKIGLLVEQTGQFSWYGSEATNGAKLYVKQHPKAGDRPIQFVTYDTGSDPEKAVTGFRKLAQKDKVAAVVGLGLTNEAAIVAPLAQSLNMPFYALSGSFTPPNGMTFSMPVQIGDMQDRVFKQMKSQGVKSFGLLTTNDATGQIADGLFAKLGQKYDIQMVAHEHMAGTDVDVTPQLTNLAGKKPDLLIAWEVGKPLGVVFNSAHQLDIKTPILISYGNLAPGFLKSLAAIQPPTVYTQATKDVFWNSLPSSDPQATEVKKFHDDYVREFKDETGLGSASGYDSVMLVSKAIEKANSTDAAKIVSAIEGLDGVKGVFGTYHLSKKNHVGLTGSDTLLGQVTDGAIQIAPTS